MADVAGENEADSGSGGPSIVAEGSGTPEEDLERNDTERVTGAYSFPIQFIQSYHNSF